MDIINKEFNNKNIHIILDKDNNPWFKGKDIAEILGYKDTDKSIRIHIDEDDKNLYMNLNLGPAVLAGLNNTNLNNTIYINESGLYSLILSSKLPSARQFKKWITSDVLPSIRKDGEYKLKQELKLSKQKLELSKQKYESTKQLSIDFEEKLKIKDKEIKQLEGKTLLWFI